MGREKRERDGKTRGRVEATTVFFSFPVFPSPLHLQHDAQSFSTNPTVHTHAIHSPKVPTTFNLPFPFLGTSYTRSNMIPLLNKDFSGNLPNKQSQCHSGRVKIMKKKYFIFCRTGKVLFFHHHRHCFSQLWRVSTTAHTPPHVSFLRAVLKRPPQRCEAKPTRG
uniref:Uncharacterized protein TCIL3000_11_12430 n=1 Tax=Trypanosoma congolense (strain IL3000) TaxID=1068625 RepID=G0V275_TRYCI|nr:unnamed protein product [Trypanosoma congolense IL3000]